MGSGFGEAHPSCLEEMCALVLTGLLFIGLTRVCLWGELKAAERALPKEKCNRN